MIQLLLFDIGDEAYALELLEIQEIVENRIRYPFPAAPEQISGAIAFHGRIVPVVNLPLLLGFGTENICNRMIVLINEYGPFALAVDQIRPLIGLEKSFFGQSGAEANQPYVRCVFAHKDEMISLMDLKQVQAAIESVCLD